MRCVRCCGATTLVPLACFLINFNSHQTRVSSRLLLLHFLRSWIRIFCVALETLFLFFFCTTARTIKLPSAPKKASIAQAFISLIFSVLLMKTKRTRTLVRRNWEICIRITSTETTIATLSRCFSCDERKSTGSAVESAVDFLVHCFFAFVSALLRCLCF